MLDVRRLRVLREVAARGSFSAAAEALAYTQSAVCSRSPRSSAKRGRGSSTAPRGACV